MRFFNLFLISLVLIGFSHIAAGNQKPQEMPLWIDMPPGNADVELTEKVTERGNESQPDRSLSDITHPSISIHMPPGDKGIGSAIVICPGGGYSRVVIDKEGHDVARWLVSFGVSGIVLKYRNPTNSSGYVGETLPHLDARRALRLVRANAQKWNINPDKVGIMGFSAGGHLASTVATHRDPKLLPLESPSDPVNMFNPIPNFVLLIYPVITLDTNLGHSGSRFNLLGKNPSLQSIQKYSNHLHVSSQSPPAFLVHTRDDGVSFLNSQLYHKACLKAGISSTFHLYQSGGHGYGIRHSNNPVHNWISHAQIWLTSQ